MKFCTAKKSLSLFTLLGMISLVGCANKMADRIALEANIDRDSEKGLKQANVAALGTLQPSGEVHLLAGPVLQMGGAPRVRSLLVEEGQRVRTGQLLATFDNDEKVFREKDRIVANIESKKLEIAVLESETRRYRSLHVIGAFSAAALETKELNLLNLKSQLRELKAFLRELDPKIADAQLRSPIDGYVLRIHARTGERPNEAGVMEIGNNDQMDAVLQVDESDISSVRVGQTVEISSENGAFLSSLSANVRLIGMRVSSRKLISNNPSADTDRDERVIDVRARLSPKDAFTVRNLVGIKIHGKFLS